MAPKVMSSQVASFANALASNLGAVEGLQEICTKNEEYWIRKAMTQLNAAVPDLQGAIRSAGAAQAWAEVTSEVLRVVRP
jgi:predicted secreted protein